MDAQIRVHSTLKEIYQARESQDDRYLAERMAKSAAGLLADLRTIETGLADLAGSLPGEYSEFCVAARSHCARVAQFVTGLAQLFEQRPKRMLSSDFNLVVTGAPGALQTIRPDLLTAFEFDLSDDPRLKSFKTDPVVTSWLILARSIQCADAFAGKGKIVISTSYSDEGFAVVKIEGLRGNKEEGFVKATEQSILLPVLEG